MMKTKKSQVAGAVKAAAALSLLPLAVQIQQVQALEYQVNDDLKVDFDTTMTYGRMWRVEQRSRDILDYPEAYKTYGYSIDQINQKELIQRANSDDGSRNFDKGDVVSSRFAVVSDLDVSYKNVGLFLRPQIFYDEVPYGETNWNDKYIDPAFTDPAAGPGMGWNNAYSSGAIERTSHFTDDYKDTLGYKARFLDAYVYGSFDIGGRNLELRIGRQVISWGEALMLQGGIAFAQNRNDASAATAPGVELKEIFLPTGAVYGQMNIDEENTVEAYWQYEWLPSTLFPTGSYFSMQDFIDGDTFVTAPYTTTYMLRKDFDPGDNNQWGFAFRHLLAEGTEMALYIVNYTDKYPMFWAQNVSATEGGLDPLAPAADGLGGGYAINYFDKIRLYGLTLNTVVNGVQVGVEYAYRANAPIVPACTAKNLMKGHCKDPSWEAAGSIPSTDLEDGALDAAQLYSWPDRAEVHTLNIGGTYIFQPTALWDTATLVGEVGSWYIAGYGNEDLQFAHLGAFTQYGEGMSMQFMPEYKNVMEGVDLVIPFFMNYGIDGSMSTFNYNEHALWWSIGAEATYLEHWRFATYYNNYSGQNSLWKDRDNVSLNVKYIF